MTSIFYLFWLQTLNSGFNCSRFFQRRFQTRFCPLVYTRTREGLRRRLNLTWPTGQNVASFVKTCQTRLTPISLIESKFYYLQISSSSPSQPVKTLPPLSRLARQPNRPGRLMTVKLSMSSGFTLKSYLWCWKLGKHQVKPNRYCKNWQNQWR